MSSRTIDGFGVYCIPCNKENVKEAYEKKKEEDEKKKKENPDIEEEIAENIDPENQPKKTCSSCKVTKNHSDFYKLKRSTDGLQCYCKECFCEKRKTFYDNNKEKINERRREKRRS